MNFFRDTSWHCVSCTGCLVKQKRTVISFLLQLLLLYMRYSYWLWYVFLIYYVYTVVLSETTSRLPAIVLTQLETLRDSFPPSDKSLSRLLGEVPYLPNKVLTLLEGMCSPGNSYKAEKENGDRVTQGLSTVWSLILLRPPFRDACLKVALKVFSILNFIAEVCIFLKMSVL